MGRPGREDGRETSPRTPGRAPAVGKRNLDDVRGDVRDATRTKERRKATVAQKSARDRAGNHARKAAAPKREQHQQRPARQRRPAGPGRAGGAAKAARQRVPKQRRTARPVQKDDFERVQLRDQDGKQQSIDRSATARHANLPRQRPNSTIRTPVEAHHTYTLDRAQADHLRAVREGAIQASSLTHSLERAGLIRNDPERYHLTPQGECAIEQLEPGGDSRHTDDDRQAPARLALESRYELTEAQRRAMADLGTFHVARQDAIERNVYGNANVAARQIQQLNDAGLLQQLRKDDITYLALTPAGRDVLREAQPNHASIHTGIPRAEQARHDAAVYDAYQHAERAIRADGGKVRRVLLEEDLKAEIRREAYISAAKTLRQQGFDIATVTDSERNLAIREATGPIARAHGVPVDDDGAVIYPDMQLEIDRPDGTVGRCNVEVVTEHYSAASVAAKQGAGFQLYLPPVSSGARSGGGGVSVQSLADELLDF